MFTIPPSIQFPFSRPHLLLMFTIAPSDHFFHSLSQPQSSFRSVFISMFSFSFSGEVLPQSSSHSLGERISPSANVYDPSIFQFSLPFFQSVPTSAEPNPLLAHWDNTAQQKGADDKFDALATLNMNCECNDKYDAQEKTNTNKSAALMTKN